VTDIVTGCKYIQWLAPTLVFLGCGALTAQEAHVSVAWKIAPACGANFPRAALRQDLEDGLRAGSIAVSRVHTASLTADINCQAGGARSVPVQQCLSLSQAVAEASAANGLHLATTWRSCQSYVCGKQNCGQLARTTQHALVRQFIPAFGALMAASKPAGSPPEAGSGLAGGTSIPVVYAGESKPVSKTGALFYLFYILTCIAVFARWQRCR
jgi:hypothetical protein